MIHWLKRQFLVWRGFASAKTRKTRAAGPWSVFFETSLSMRLFLVALFVFSFFLTTTWPALPTHPFHVLLKIILWLGCFVGVLVLFKPDLWRSSRLLTLTLICLLVHVTVNKTIFFWLHDFWQVKYSINTTSGAVPLVTSALGVMLITILVDARAGILTALLALIGELILTQPQIGADTLLSSLIIDLAAIILTCNVRTRWHLIRAGLALSVIGLAVSWVFMMVHSFWLWPIASWWPLQGAIVFWAFAIGMGTAILVGILLPIVEWTFDCTTDISWLEWTDLNHPLLKRLTLEAPGTYHHSLMVANLAEAAAEKIDANPMICRVMAYFHDIGKLAKPEYFIENNSLHYNPHHELTPSISALIIIGHVKEGIDLGLTYHLPQQVIDVIEQHHGTTLVYYFYRKAIQHHDDVAEGGRILGVEVQEKQEVDAESFRYPGPVPQSTECAIVSLADSIESSARALRHPTPQNIERLVRSMISRRIAEGQLNESGLTLDQIEELAKSFIFTLKNMLHSRISYPKEPSIQKSL